MIKCVNIRLYRLSVYQVYFLLYLYIFCAQWTMVTDSVARCDCLLYTLWLMWLKWVKWSNTYHYGAVSGDKSVLSLQLKWPEEEAARHCIELRPFLCCNI